MLHYYDSPCGRALCRFYPDSPADVNPHLKCRLGKNELHELRGVKLFIQFSAKLFLPNLDSWTCKLELTSKMASS